MKLKTSNLQTTTPVGAEVSPFANSQTQHNRSKKIPDLVLPVNSSSETEKINDIIFIEEPSSLNILKANKNIIDKTANLASNASKLASVLASSVNQQQQQQPLQNGTKSFPKKFESQPTPQPAYKYEISNVYQRAPSDISIDNNHRETYFKYRYTSSQRPETFLNKVVTSLNPAPATHNLNSSSLDLTHANTTSNNQNLSNDHNTNNNNSNILNNKNANPSMIANKLREEPAQSMTHYTQKFSKSMFGNPVGVPSGSTVAPTDNNNINNTNNSPTVKFANDLMTTTTNTPSHMMINALNNNNNNNKSPSRNSSISNLNQSPLSMVNSASFKNMPGTATMYGASTSPSHTQITNGATAASSSKKNTPTTLLTRSATMKYMSKPFTTTAEPGSSPYLNHSPKPLQTQHFNYTGYNNNGVSKSPSTHNRKQQFLQTPISTPVESGKFNSSKDSLNNNTNNNNNGAVNRSSSIKSNRDKASLTNYFSSLYNQNRLLSNSNLGMNFFSASNSLTNSMNNGPAANASNGNFNANSHNLNLYNNLNLSKLHQQQQQKKQQPVSLRNNSISSANYTGNHHLVKTALKGQDAATAAATNQSTTKNSLENVLNGFDLLLAASSSNDAYKIGSSQNLIDINNPSLRLVCSTHHQSNNLLQNRIKRSEELLLIESNNLNDESVEIKPLLRSNLLKNLPSNDNLLNENANAETNNETNKTANGFINKLAKGEMLKKTKSFSMFDARLQQQQQQGKPSAELPDNTLIYKQNTNFNLLNLNAAKMSQHTDQPVPVSTQQYEQQQQQLQNAVNAIQRTSSRISMKSRDPNDSYAYTNVQQYIEENDLMPTEKAVSIRKWIKEVNVFKEDWDKRTVEINIID